MLELPDTNSQLVKDAADYFNAGGDTAGIVTLIDTAPEWTPATKIPVSEPGEPVADMRGEIVSILTNGKLSPTEQRTRIANAVTEALAGRGRFFFHAERKDFNSAMYFDNGRKTLLRIRADSFLAWLAQWLAVNKRGRGFQIRCRPG